MLLLSGCFAPPIEPALDGSRIWQEPGLFNKIPVQGNSSQYKISELAPGLILPFHDPWIEQRWGVVSLQILSWSGGVDYLTAGHPGYENDSTGWLDMGVTDWNSTHFRVSVSLRPWFDPQFVRPHLANFLRNITGASEFQISKWVDETDWKEENSPVYHWGSGQLFIRHPLRASELFEDLRKENVPIFETNSTLVGRQYLEVGRILYEGAWKFTFHLRVRTIEWTEDSGTFEFFVDPSNATAFRHQGDENVPDSEMNDRLNETFADLGLGTPHPDRWKAWHCRRYSNQCYGQLSILDPETTTRTWRSYPFGLTSRM